MDRSVFLEIENMIVRRNAKSCAPFTDTRRGAAYRPHGFLQYNVDVKSLDVFSEFCWNFGSVCMNQRAISFNLICHMQFSEISVFSVFRNFRPIRKRKSGFFGTVGILRSSPICRYPADVCRCPGWATIGQNGKTGFPALARSGSGIPDF